MSSWIKRALLLLLLVAALAWWQRGPIAMAIVERSIPKRMALDAMAELPDGLHVGLCGAGSPFPDERRSGPCTLVLAGKRLFVVDAGSGSVRNIGKLGFSHGQIEAVLLTHFHSDHIDGLGELMLQRWVSASRTEPLPVYGPTGVESVVAGLAQAYTLDRGYRVAHHGDATVPASGFGGTAKPFAAGSGEPVSLIKDGELEILAFKVDHRPVDPAVGYRISYKGRSVVISGDSKKAASIQAAAKGVDLLVHEALSPQMVGLLRQAAEKAGRPKLAKIFADIVDYHATPEQAAETARDAQVGMLLLNHIAPPLPLPGMEEVFAGQAPKIYTGPFKVGIDGDFITMPAGSKEIRAGKRF